MITLICLIIIDVALTALFVLQILTYRAKRKRENKAADDYYKRRIVILDTDDIARLEEEYEMGGDPDPQERRRT